MPDQTGVPTFEEVANWQNRWKHEWLDDVKYILQVYPKTAVWRISKRSWYTKENGFERWPEADAEASAYLSNLQTYTRMKGVSRVRWVILDLRGIALAAFKSAGCQLAFARLDGATLDKLLFRRWDLSHANLRRMFVTETLAYNINCFGADLRHTVLRDCHIHKSQFSTARASNSAFVFSTFCHMSFSDGTLQDSAVTSVRFFKCHFGGTRFYGADLRWTEFINCDLRHARLRSFSMSPFVFTSTFFGRFARGSDCLHRKVIEHNDYTLFTRSTVGAMDLQTYIETCSQIRLCFKDNGLLHEAARYYEQEEKWRTRLMWREIGEWRGIRKRKNTGKSAGVLLRFLSEWLIGYGERPGRGVLASGGIIVICAMLFLIFGIVDMQSWGEPRTVSVFNTSLQWLPYYFFIALRFSTECFTTLGFSVIQPAEGVSHWIASMEGLVGVLLIAMVTVTWARKVIRD